MGPLRLVALAAFLSCTVRGADIVIDTGPGYGGFRGGFSLGTAPDGQGGQSLAGMFYIPSLTHVTSAQGWIATFDTQFGAQFTNAFQTTLTVGIATNTGGFPGELLFQSSLIVHGSQPAAWTGPTGLDWRLLPGTYWIVFSTPDPLGYMAVLDPAQPWFSPLDKYAAKDTAEWYDFNAKVPTEQHWLGVQILGQNSPPGVPDGGYTAGFLAFVLACLAAVARGRWRP
jgi:hypothetical protein